MAKKGDHRQNLGLKCTVCKSVNYITQRNKINTEGKLMFKKYCKNCKKKTDHKEIEKLK